MKDIERSEIKITLDDKVILKISDTMRKVICNDIKSQEFTSDIERRLVYTIMDKYLSCFKRLKDNWDPILESRGIETIPTNKEKYAELVFSQPDYKSRSEREKV